MQLIENKPLQTVENLFLGSRYVSHYMKDIQIYEIDQQKNRFHFLVQQFLSNHVTNHVMVLLGLTVNTQTGASTKQEQAPLSLDILKEYIAALMICTGKKCQWKANDVVTLMKELQRDYEVLPAVAGIQTAEYWQSLIPGIRIKADQFLDALFEKANVS